MNTFNMIKALNRSDLRAIAGKKMNEHTVARLGGKT